MGECVIRNGNWIHDFSR